MVGVSVGAWALHLAVAASVVALVGIRRRTVGVAALAVATIAAAVAVVALGHAFWANDYSLAYVADHARRDASPATRLSGLWGGMGGSLLCFAAGVAVATLVAAWRAPVEPRGIVAAVGGAVTASLTGFVVVLSDPFQRLEIPAIDGGGLTPILEHPAMLYHPPLVYAGLTSLSAAFALTVAALWQGPLDGTWRESVRRWLLVPWTLLAVGMLTGAHWAYVELGWGGYWAWDPVENTALLPWLAVTAGFHALRRAEGRDGAAARAAAVLVLGAFLLALLGALLTRSGVTASVHAFAEARDIGRAFGALLLVTSAAVVGLVVRHRRRWPVRLSPTASPRARALRLQNGLLLAALAAVLLGSVWPLLADLRGDRGLSVGGEWFAAVCGPVAVTLLLVMAIGPSLGRRRLGSLALPPAVGAAIGLALAAADGWTTVFGLATAAAGGGALVGAGTALVRDRRTPRRFGSHVAHLGAALFLVGVAGTTTGATETVSLAEGQATEVHGRTVVNDGATVATDPAPNTRAVVATIVIDGRAYRPRLVAHTVRHRLLAESALHSTWQEDVQVMLRDARDDGGVVLQVGVHPLQQLVWWGGLLLVAGGLLAATGRAVTPPDPGRPRDGGAGSPAAIPTRLLAAGPAPAPPLAAPGATAPSARA